MGAACGAEATAKKPFIITKDALQAKVFGMGYPSMPVYSVEQFYDQLAEKGMMPKHEDPNENYGKKFKIMNYNERSKMFFIKFIVIPKI